MQGTARRADMPAAAEALRNARDVRALRAHTDAVGILFKPLHKEDDLCSLDDAQFVEESLRRGDFLRPFLVDKDRRHPAVIEHFETSDRAYLRHDLVVGLHLHCDRDDVRFHTDFDEIRRRAHCMRRGVREAEKARIRRHPRIEAGRDIERECAAHRENQIVHDLAGRGIVRIQIEIFRRLIVRHMMVDVEHAHGVHGIDHRARTLQLHIADDEEVCRVALPLCGTLNLLNPRQDVKDTGNLIVDQHARILALLSQVVHQPKRRADGVPIGTDVRGEDDGLSVTYDFGCLIKRNLHASSPFSVIGLSS